MAFGKIVVSGFLFAIADYFISLANSQSDNFVKGACWVAGGAIYIVTAYLLSVGAIELYESRHK